ncbi:MAG: hypothetical protein SFU55_03345 [Methylophilus sp.]|nr:hypothetical protein [Methylophilus sp.]
MTIKPHPFISKKLTRHFAITFIAFWLLMLLCIYGNRIIPDFEANHYFLIFFTTIWILLIYFFASVWWSLKRLKCPDCQQRTQPYKQHPLLPDYHSAYCKHCDTLWHLGIGNSTD